MQMDDAKSQSFTDNRACDFDPGLPMDDQLIDQIYESSFIPERWPSVLDALSRIVDAPGGAMGIYDQDLEIGCWSASQSISDRTRQFIDEGWAKRGRFGARFLDRCGSQSRFFFDEDLLDNDERASEPVYRDFWGARGGGRVAIADMASPLGERVFCAFVRKDNRGPFEHETVRKLDFFRPHLARSAIIASELRLTEARSLGVLLGRLKLPALVLDSLGKALEANEIAQSRSDLFQWRGLGQFSLADEAADDQLYDARQRLAHDENGSTSSFAVHDATGCATELAHLIPIRRAARDIFKRGAALLLLTPAGAEAGLGEPLFKSLMN